MRLLPIAGLVCCAAGHGALRAQEPAPPPARTLTSAETGCDSSLAAPTDSLYEADAVDRKVRPPYVRVGELPYRGREVLTGRTMLRFVVDTSGWVERCSIRLVEESSAEWTTRVLPAMRGSRSEPARKGGRRVRQVVYQVFTYHSDGRSTVSQ